MKKHAKYAASSAHRWTKCAGSIKLSERAPKPKSSRAADEGTKAHALMDYALNSGVKNVIEHFSHPTDGYPHEMRFHVQSFIDFVRSELKPGFELLVEEKIQLSILHPTEAFGTVDVAVIEPFGALHVIDLKYGKSFVSAKDNAQMIYYALGIAHRLKFDIDAIKTTIFQPRTPFEASRSFSFDLKYLKEWEAFFRDKIEDCETANMDNINSFNAGEHCKFCPALEICPGMKKENRSRAERHFDPIL